jgi:hypothetical protein
VGGKPSGYAIDNEKLNPREWAGRLQQQWNVAEQENRTPRP